MQLTFTATMITWLYCANMRRISLRDTHAWTRRGRPPPCLLPRVDWKCKTWNWRTKWQNVTSRATRGTGDSWNNSRSGYYGNWHSISTGGGQWRSGFHRFKLNIRWTLLQPHGAAQAHTKDKNVHSTHTKMITNLKNRKLFNIRQNCELMYSVLFFIYSITLYPTLSCWALLATKVSM